MRPLHLVASNFAVASLVAFTAPVGAQAPDTQQQRPGGFFHTLSQEQRLMLFIDMRKQTQGMTDEQRHSYREAQRQKLGAMNDSDRARFAAQLQQEWDALPVQEQEQIRQQVQARRDRQAHPESSESPSPQ